MLIFLVAAGGIHLRVNLSYRRRCQDVKEKPLKELKRPRRNQLLQKSSRPARKDKVNIYFLERTSRPHWKKFTGQFSINKGGTLLI
jgi:hypothetical protein